MSEISLFLIIKRILDGFIKTIF